MVPWVKVQPCHCSGLGHCSGVGLIPALEGSRCSTASPPPIPSPSDPCPEEPSIVGLEGRLGGGGVRGYFGRVGDLGLLKAAESRKMRFGQQGQCQEEEMGRWGMDGELNC